METINSFSNGMNSDVSKQIHSKDSYLQALNFRPLTELGASNGSLVNIKGNECKITFPDLQPVFKLIVTEGTNSTDNSTDIEINGVTYTYSTLNNNTKGLDLYNWIIANFENCYQYTGSTVVNKTFAVAYKDNYIVIYNQPVYQDCTTVASVASAIVLTPTTSDGSQANLYFVNQGVANSLTQNTTKPYVAGCPSDLIIPIGSTFILNDIYILTATDNPTYGPAGYSAEIPANDELQFGGAIWKLNIDDITKQHTLTLIYSNNLDFTKYHPIPPSAITGRYESLEIQRIYWSDNYNKIRVLNCTQPQLMALDPTQLSVMPKVEYIQAILSSIGTASPGLPAGCFQAGYRLSKVLGSVTNYSELSNPVYLTTNAESDAFQDYQGSLGASGKSITWKLTGLDMNYDQIEFIVTYRDSESAVPVITSLGTTTLLEDMTFTYSDTTVTTYTEVTLEEFLLFNGTFTHAKTCDTKDNRLFWGNVRAPRKNLQSFDARAFRAASDGKIKLKNSGTTHDYTSLASAAALPETEDTINEYYDASGDYNSRACYLKLSTVGNPQPELGGEGVNISYSFKTFSIQSDNNLSISTGDDYDLGTPQSPYRSTGTVSGTVDLHYKYPQNNKFQALKQPERTSLLKGFQHEEIYRFAFQAFDKQGNPYFSKWIGDIKMPSYGDYNHHPDATASAYFTGAGINPDFRLSFAVNYSTQYQQVLGIEFDVNTNLVKDIIGGWQIVRVKRDGNNKTIWGSGMINPFAPDNTNPLAVSGTCLPASWNSNRSLYSITAPPIPPILQRHYTPYPSQWTVETLNTETDTPTDINIADIKMFDCWDFDIGFRPSFAVGDKLLVRSRVKCVNYNAGGDSGYRAFFTAGIKNYDSSGNRIPQTTNRIDGSHSVAYLDNTNYDAGPLNPFFIMKMLDDTTYCNYTDFLTTNSNDYKILKGTYINGNTEITSLTGGYTIRNYGYDVALNGVGATNKPCFGKQTTILELDSPLYTYFTYGCRANDTEFKKVLALYYKPNPNLYNGATYAARSTNEYIPCSEYISTNENNTNVNNNITLTVFGGDIFTAIYDMMKTCKFADGTGSEFRVMQHNSSGTFISAGANPFALRAAQFSTSFFFPTTVTHNVELRLGEHPNRSISSDLGYDEDKYSYNTYCNAENDTKVYFPEPLNFQNADEWINRIYWSELKFNNEPLDSWAVYLTDAFYDVEGNYGGINALISLKENMYYLQDRGVGMLLINPVSMINDSAGTPIKLGNGTDAHVIQKHYYKAIDTGTVHQWSVYRSQSAITFIDARHKKIYLFNGESVTPISDVKGQRNFVIKRLHNKLLKNDNPIINKGIITTYDYYHNEFLYTFNNVLTEDTTNNENLTLAYSEILDAFTGMYSFTPNLYINSNKYLISTNSSNKLWFHNYGNYGLFYNTQYPSTLKLIVNDNPLHTKIFDNSTWNSESIKDNVEWNDDLNIYPGSPTNPSYPDDVNHQSDTFTKIRCYNDWQNTDWLTLSTISPNNTLTRKERNFNVQIPRNKFDYDSTAPSLVSLFNPANLTKTLFGERIRDKYMIVDLYYPNTLNNRFIVNNFKTNYRISDR